jgi:hypothetical protein
MQVTVIPHVSSPDQPISAEASKSVGYTGWMPQDSMFESQQGQEIVSGRLFALPSHVYDAYRGCR